MEERKRESESERGEGRPEDREREGNSKMAPRMCPIETEHEHR